MAKGKAAKQTDAADGDAAVILARKLEEYGERFMSMFDDHHVPSAKKARTVVAAPTARLVGAKSDPSTADDSPSAARRRGHAGAGPGPGSALLGNNARSDPSRRPQGAVIRRMGEIDAIMNAAATGKGDRPHQQRSEPLKQAPQQARWHQQDAARAAPVVDMRRERKLFMSSKASKVHAFEQALPPEAATAEADDDGMSLSPADWQKLQMEVERFGASALDKKSAKLYRRRMLSQLGAKAEKGPRTALSLGKGMAKMAAKRDSRALEEAIGSGMVQRKGLGKKRRALKEKQRDKGLMEAGPSFKDGVLRVKKPVTKTHAQGKMRLPKGF